MQSFPSNMFTEKAVSPERLLKLSLVCLAEWPIEYLSIVFKASIQHGDDTIGKRIS